MRKEELNKTEERKFCFDVYMNNGFKKVIQSTESEILKIAKKSHAVVMVVKMYYKNDVFKRKTIFVR